MLPAGAQIPVISEVSSSVVVCVQIVPKERHILGNAVSYLIANYYFY